MNILKSAILLKKKIKNRSRRLVKCNGKNNTGKITVRHKITGPKKKLSQIHFQNFVEPLFVSAVNYSSLRTAKIAVLFSIKKKQFFYILASSGLKKGHFFNPAKELKNGFRSFLGSFPLGAKIYGLGNHSFFKKAVFVRSAGNFARIIQKSVNFCLVKLCSGKIKRLNSSVLASLGKVSNSNHFFFNLGKAGRNLKFGVRPCVRGVAMNPNDHPHGGGEGKSSGGRPSVSPWAKPAHLKRKKN